MPVHVKICGLSTPETLDAAVLGGASHVGLNFYLRSPRYVEPDRAAALVRRLPAHVTPVAVVVNEDRERLEFLRRATGIGIIQLHGDESPAFAAALGGDVWKAVPIKTRQDLKACAPFQGAVSRILYDAKPPEGADLPGGTGLRIDWSLLEDYDHPIAWALAGGLDPENVAEAIRQSRSTFVDVSSGIESAPGIKDVDKIAAFLKAANP